MTQRGFDSPVSLLQCDVPVRPVRPFQPHLREPLLILLPAVVRRQAVIGLVACDWPRASGGNHCGHKHRAGTVSVQVVFASVRVRSFGRVERGQKENESGRAKELKCGSFTLALARPSERGESEAKGHVGMCVPGCVKEHV